MGGDCRVLLGAPMLDLRTVFKSVSSVLSLVPPAFFGFQLHGPSSSPLSRRVLSLKAGVRLTDSMQNFAK